MVGMADPDDPLMHLLSTYRPASDSEETEIAQMVQLVSGAAAEQGWSQERPVHFTASALVVHPPTRRVLLRWHARQRSWLQIGGHGEPGEHDPVQIALREGREETGLTDLRPWPDAAMVHAVIVPVAPKGDSPAHRHADLRFVLATDEPDAAVPEHADAPLRWLSLRQATDLTAERNLRETLARLEGILAEQ